METINTEILVSSLFYIGFASLFTYTLGQLSIDNYKSRMFEFIDQETYSYFNEYVIFDGFAYRLKDGITLDTNVSPVSTRELPLKYALYTNKKLIEYLSNLDFRKIILKKIKLLDIDRVDNFDSLFCDKEKNY